MSIIQEQIKVWYDKDHGHDLDRELLYAIVLETLNQRCSPDDFEKAIRGKNKAQNAYKLSEHLHTFYFYLKKEGKLL